jgi:hypothetical protein
MTAKEILADLKLKVKDFFDFPPTAPAAPAAPAPTQTPAPMLVSYAVDGGQPVFVNIADDGIADIDQGDQVYGDAAMASPYPDGTFKVTGTDFGFTVASGVVSAVTDPDAKGPGTPIANATTPAAPAAAATPPVPPTPAKPPMPVTQAAMREIVQKFAVGDPEQRLSNLELVCKALMENCFGYQIEAEERAVSTSQAIAIYKTTLDDQAAAMAKQEKIIQNYGETLKGLFSLVEKLVELPTAPPVTINGHKKEVFDKKEKGEAKMAAIGIALKDIKHQ